MAPSFTATQRSNGTSVSSSTLQRPTTRGNAEPMRTPTDSFDSTYPKAYPWPPSHKPAVMPSHSASIGARENGTTTPPRSNNSPATIASLAPHNRLRRALTFPLFYCFKVLPDADAPRGWHFFCDLDSP